MLSHLESELFITQSSFSGSRSIDLSGNNFESLFADADNEKAVDNFNLRTEDLFTDVLTDKGDSGRGIITVSDKEIQARNEARIPQNTKRATSWSTRVWEITSHLSEWATRRRKLCPMFCKDQQLIIRGPQWKAMKHRLRKSANVRQKKTLLSLILVIVASYLIFPNKHL